VGEFASIAGVTLAYVYGIAAGGSIVVSAIAVYASVVTLQKLSAKQTVYSALRKQEEKEADGVSADGGDR
jgi:zinc transport system permease protein